MAERLSGNPERLLPCFLDRLRDDHPNETKESRNQRIVSMRQYRASVLRDLAWLLNTKQHPEEDGLDEFPEVSSSVLNYGTPDLCGSTASSLDGMELRRRLVEAIKRFEPRIRPETLEVDILLQPGQMSGNTLSFEIKGELWAEPIPEQLDVRTDVDLETGQFEVKGRTSG